MTSINTLNIWLDMADKGDPMRRGAAIDMLGECLYENITLKGLSEMFVFALTSIAIDDPEDTYQSLANEVYVFNRIVQALWDEDKTVVQTAARALRELGDPIFRVFSDCLVKDYQEDLQQWAAEGLGKLKDPRGTEALLTGLKSTYASVRCLCAEALDQIQGPKAIEQLIDTANHDPEDNVRARA